MNMADPDDFPQMEAFDEWLYEQERFLALSCDDLKHLITCGEHAMGTEDLSAIWGLITRLRQDTHRAKLNLKQLGEAAIHSLDDFETLAHLARLCIAAMQDIHKSETRWQNGKDIPEGSDQRSPLRKVSGGEISLKQSCGSSAPPAHLPCCLTGWLRQETKGIGPE